MSFQKVFLSLTATMVVGVLMSGCSSACSSLDCGACDDSASRAACQIIVDADDDDLCQAALDNPGYASCQ